jgi:hypothetical protein
VSGTDAPPRIFIVTYRAAFGRRRKVSMWIKVPYSGLFNLLDVLGRAVATKQVMWFRVDVPTVIFPENRERLERWPVALAASSEITGVDWNA